MDWLNENWWECDKPRNLPINCNAKAVVSLKPGNEVLDTIVDCYTVLLERRENTLFAHQDGAVKYYFMSPWFFQVMGAHHCKPMKKNPAKRKASEWAAIDADFRAYGTKEGATMVTNCDYIIMPVATGGHWILFLWSIQNFRVSLFDPLRDDTPYMKLKQIYKTEFYIVVYFIFLFFLISSSP